MARKNANPKASTVKNVEAAASPEVAECDRADLVASPETAVLEETPDAPLTESDIAVLRRRMSGEELKALLRQQRREARQAEKGY